MIHIDLKQLRAVALATGRKDIRYYLNGVLVEIGPNGQTFLVATDGDRMHVAQGLICDYGIPQGQTIIPIDVVNIVTKLKGDVVQFVPAERGKTGRLGTQEYEAVDGVFPNWRRVLPSNCQKKETFGNVNPEYIADFGRALKYLGVKHPCASVHTQPGADKIWPVHLLKSHARQDFIGVVMGTGPKGNVNDEGWFAAQSTSLPFWLN